MIRTTHPITPTQLTPTTFTAWLQGHIDPPSESLNIPDLARLFNHTTNSYKYLFFLFLLDILRRYPCQPTSPIAFFDLIVEMLANAWFPHSYTPSPTPPYPPPSGASRSNPTSTWPTPTTCSTWNTCATPTTKPCPPDHPGR